MAGKLIWRWFAIVVNYLLFIYYLCGKDTKNYEEAQRILDNMKSCGESLCGDTNDTKVDCGCGKIVY